eukprot:c50597_g1_i1 orf=111-323(+)
MWWSVEVLRQRHNLSLREMQVRKEVLNRISEWFPINCNVAKNQVLEVLCWSNGDRLNKTKTRAVYKILGR